MCSRKWTRRRHTSGCRTSWRACAPCIDSAQRPKLRFADYATSLLERKIQTGDIRSPKGQERWRYTLEHLIAGTLLEDEQVSVGGFGELFMDQIRAEHVGAWKAAIVQLINGRHYSPPPRTDGFRPCA